MGFTSQCKIFAKIFRDQIKQIFNVVDADKSGALTKDEFVNIAKSESMQDRFTKIMRKLRIDYKRKGLLKCHKGWAYF